MTEEEEDFTVFIDGGFDIPSRPVTVGLCLRGKLSAFHMKLLLSSCYSPAKHMAHSFDIILFYSLTNSVKWTPFRCNLLKDSLLSASEAGLNSAQRTPFFCICSYTDG